MKEYNSQAFVPEEVKAGLHLEFIKDLLKISSKLSGSRYFDIHITTDGYCTIIEWNETDPKNGLSGFKFIDEDEAIMKEVYFPDNHSEYLFPEEVDERIAEWHKENPEWVLNSYGIWTNEKENKEFKEMIEKEKSK